MKRMTMTISIDGFASYLKGRISAEKLSVDDFAAKYGTHRQVIYALMQPGRFPSKNLAKALGLEWVLLDKEPSPSEEPAPPVAKKKPKPK